MNQITQLLSGGELLTLIIVLAITIALTEVAKTFIRRWTLAKTNDTTPRLIAFAIGYVLTVWSWPPASEIDPRLMALFVGALNPALYRLARHKWPTIAKAMSLRKCEPSDPENEKTKHEREQ